MTTASQKTVKRLRKMGLSKQTALRWVENHIADRELEDAPLVKSEVVYDPRRAERLRVGRFQLQGRRPTR